MNRTYWHAKFLDDLITPDIKRKSHPHCLKINIRLPLVINRCKQKFCFWGLLISSGGHLANVPRTKNEVILCRWTLVHPIQKQWLSQNSQKIRGVSNAKKDITLRRTEFQDENTPEEVAKAHKGLFPFNIYPSRLERRCQVCRFLPQQNQTELRTLPTI